MHELSLLLLFYLMWCIYQNQIRRRKWSSLLFCSLCLFFLLGWKWRTIRDV